MSETLEDGHETTIIVREFGQNLRLLAVPVT